MLQAKTDITDVEFTEVAATPDEQAKPLSIPETITFLLEQAEVENPEAWLTGLNPVALTSPDLNIQRFIVNRHWLGLLLNVPDDKMKETMNARGCLVNGKWELADWVQHFKKMVIPCAISVGVLKKKD